MARSYHQIKSDKPYIHDEESHYPKDCKAYKEPQIPSSFEEINKSYSYQNPETTEDSEPIDRSFLVDPDYISIQEFVKNNNKVLMLIDKKIEKILKILKKYLPK